MAFFHLFFTRYTHLDRRTPAMSLTSVIPAKAGIQSPPQPPRLPWVVSPS
jgi:hypothetical protein